MKARLLKIAILLLLASSCKMYDTSAQYTCQRPDSLSDGFDVGTLELISPANLPGSWATPIPGGPKTTSNLVK